MLIFTSCTNNYIPKARVLASSLKSFHPDWEFCLLLGEAPPAGFSLEREPFDRLLFFDQIGIPAYKAWLFRHRVVEICTAAKGPALDYFITTEKQDKVIYLDPDIMVMNSLSKLDNDLDHYDIILTPHQLTPQKTPRSIIDNEICSLKHGVYNLGFVAVANRVQGQQFSRWWRDRLYEYCYDDIPNGIFTDQRWCDLAPAFFPNLHILRDPGYNAASWNLTDRTITQRPDDVFMANNTLLRFYHFTGYDSGAGETMVSIYGSHMPAVADLWKIYAQRLDNFDHASMKTLKWHYMTFDDGTPITDAMRLEYRNNKELQYRFPDPFLTEGEHSTFLQWYEKEHPPIGKNELPPFVALWRKGRQLLPLTRKYIAKHGGLRHALPRLYRKSLESFRYGGVQGFIAKIKMFRDDAQQTWTPPSRTFNALIDAWKTSSWDRLCDEAYLLAETFATEKRTICIIDHQYGGGANAYREKRITEWRSAGYDVLLLTWDIHTIKVNALAYTQYGNLYFSLDGLEELLNQDMIHCNEVFVNEIALWSIKEKQCQENYHTAVPRLIVQIIDLADKWNADIKITFHDYYALCPSYTLLNAWGEYCNLPDIEQCTDCLNCMRDPILPSKFSLKEWRSSWFKLLKKAKYIYFFSSTALNIVKKIYLFQDNQIILQPHAPLHTWTTQYRIPSRKGMCVAVIGTILPQKGANIVRQLGKLLGPNEDLIVIGELFGNHSLGKVRVHGRYESADLPAILERYEVTVALLPSIWPETFSYVTQECMQLGLPLVAFRLGAQGERVGDWEHGLLADEVSAESAYQALRNLDARRFSA